MSSEQDLRRFPLSRRTFVKTLSLACLAGSPILKACNLLSGENQFQEKKMEPSRPKDSSDLPRSPRPPRFSASSFRLPLHPASLLG